MKTSKDFDLREFISPDTYKRWGHKSIWFVNKKVLYFAQFHKDFLTDHYRKIYGSKLVKVTVTVNNWLFGGDKIGRGYREPQQYAKGGQFEDDPFSESLHRQGLAVDLIVVLHFADGKKLLIDSKTQILIILNNWETYKQTGLTTVESPAYAPTWLHADFRNIDQYDLHIVKPRS